MNWNDMIYILREVILTIGASVMLLVPVTGGRGAKLSAKWMMIILLAVPAGSLIICSHAVENIDQSRQLQAMFALDPFSIFFKLLFIAAMAMLVMMSDDFLKESRYSPWEYYSLLGFALCGMMFMASGVHLITIYIGLQLLSLWRSTLPGSSNSELKSPERAVKDL